MGNVVRVPQSRCRAGVARGDITPPVGIYHRMWGAATHERATGVHRPLLATVLWLGTEEGERSQTLIVVALDHCLLDQAEIELIQGAAAAATNAGPEQVLVTLSHTHAAGLMSRSRAQLPGGELIGPYLEEMAAVAGRLAGEAARNAGPATIRYGQGRCALAGERDFFDEAAGEYVCGFNPQGAADDTLVVAVIEGAGGKRLATVVNYACHPTTLAWQNTLISPDFVGAMRETVERECGVGEAEAPCIFLQGASGDLGPREGFVGEVAIADRNGRELGFAALAAVTATPAAGGEFAYGGPVVSGATIGTWRYRPVDGEQARQQCRWQVERWREPLAYRGDLPSLAETRATIEQLSRDQAEADAAGRGEEARDVHARIEQATRQLWRLEALPPGAFALSITLARIGDAVWLFVPGEHYQILQTTLRARFPNVPLVVATITNGWQPGYVPPADRYGRGIYQERIAVVGAGSAERVIEAVSERIGRLFA